MLTAKKALRNLILWILAGLALLGGVTILFDPFYQYHGAIPGITGALYERETQVIGSIRNFTYDSILLGSSVVENCDGDYLDAQYGIRTLKAVKGSASTADLMYYLQAAHEEQHIRHVFYGMDLFALLAPCEVTVVSEYSPQYLYTETILDDGQYLFNKDVLLEKIPQLLAYSITGKKTGGQAYDWSAEKVFSTEQAMRAYERPTEPTETLPLKDSSQERQNVLDNLALIKEEISSHKETRYTIFFPPYSLLYWDGICRNGEFDSYCYALEEALSQLAGYENVELYYFQAEEEIVLNLDLYMDKTHYAPQINQYMLTCMAEQSPTYLLTEDNIQEAAERLRGMCEKITSTEIYRYYPEGE